MEKEASSGVKELQKYTCVNNFSFFILESQVDRR